MSKAKSTKAAGPGAELVSIRLDRIEASAANPRKHFRDEGLEELARSIEAHGVLEPVLVRELGGPGRYELLAGERRVRAARLAGLAEIPAIVRDDDDVSAEAIRLVENLQREDLTPCEVADHYRRLIDVHGQTAEAIAAKVGLTARSIEQQLSLTKLGADARTVVDSGTVDKTVAVRAASIPDAGLQAAFLGAVVGRRLTFREAEELLASDYQRSLSKAQFSAKDATLVAEAGACTTCPFNTTNMTREASAEARPTAKVTKAKKGKAGGELRASTNVCTNLACWKTKDEAHWERTADEAAAIGLRVLSAKDQKKAFPPNYSRDYLANWEVKLEDLADVLGRSVYISGSGSKPVKDLLTDEQIGEITAGNVAIGRYQSGRVAHLVPREVADKLRSRAEAGARKKTNEKKAAAGKGGELSEETKRRHLQADVRKASEELYPQLAGVLERKATPPEGESRTRYTIDECAHMLRAHLVWYLTNQIVDGHTGTVGQAVIEDVLGVDLEKVAARGSGSHEKYLQSKRDRLKAELDATNDARLCEILVRVHTEASLGRNYDSTKLTPWMLSACALHEVDAPGVLGKHFDARQASYKEASRKAKERADKQKLAAKASAPARAVTQTAARRDPDETPAGRKAKRLAKELSKLDEYDGVDPPAVEDLETIDVQVADETEVEMIAGGVAELLGRDVEHELVETDPGDEDPDLQAAALEPRHPADCGPCRVCGCTADDPCVEGCERQEASLCMACAVLSPRELHEFAQRRTKLASLEVGSRQRFDRSAALDRDVANARSVRAAARAS